MTIQLKLDGANQPKLLRLLEWLKEVGMVQSWKIETPDAGANHPPHGNRKGDDGQLSPAARTALERVEKLKSIQPDWDGYNADAPSPVAIASAGHFISKADRDGLSVYFTAPGRGGEVLVEFKTGTGKAAEVYFEPEGGAEVLMYEDEECVKEGRLDENYKHLIAFLHA